MTGMEPAFCGNYSTFEMPIYSIKESKSKGIQFLHKLYFQSYRDVYTHSMCNSQCVFDCRQVGYDAEIMTELLLRNISDLHVYQCDRYQIVRIVQWIFLTCKYVFISLRTKIHSDGRQMMPLFYQPKVCHEILVDGCALQPSYLVRMS